VSARIYGRIFASGAYPQLVRMKRGNPGSVR